jgi:transcriptional regulator with XRE-family HTH domain
LRTAGATFCVHEALAERGVYAYTLCVQLRLRYWRERRGYSMRELGNVAGVEFSTVHRIETGRISPTVAMLEKLARALGIHVRDFFPPPRRRQPKRRR